MNLDRNFCFRPEKVPSCQWYYSPPRSGTNSRRPVSHARWNRKYLGNWGKNLTRLSIFKVPENNAWNCMAWDAQAKCLRSPKQESLPREWIKEILTLLAGLAPTPAWHQHRANPPILAIEALGEERSARGFATHHSLAIGYLQSILGDQPLFGALQALRGNGIGQMILLSIRQAILQRSQLAQAVTYRVKC